MTIWHGQARLRVGSSRKPDESHSKVSISNELQLSIIHQAMCEWAEVRERVCHPLVMPINDCRAAIAFSSHLNTLGVDN